MTRKRRASCLIGPHKTAGRWNASTIYIGPRIDAAARRHDLDIQVSTRDPAAKGFAPLPVRWRIEASFGTLGTDA